MNVWVKEGKAFVPKFTRAVICWKAVKVGISHAKCLKMLLWRNRAEQKMWQSDQSHEKLARVTHKHVHDWQMRGYQASDYKLVLIVFFILQICTHLRRRAALLQVYIMHSFTSCDPSNRDPKPVYRVIMCCMHPPSRHTATQLQLGKSWREIPGTSVCKYRCESKEVLLKTYW